MSYESLMAKGYKYKNFLMAYKTWCKKDFNKNSSKQSYIEPIDENKLF